MAVNVWVTWSGVKFLGLFNNCYTFNKGCASLLLMCRGGVLFSYPQSYFVCLVIKSLILVINLFAIRVTCISCSVHIMCFFLLSVWMKVHCMPLVTSYCVVFVSGGSSVNKSRILASNETIDFVFFSGANWSAGEVVICGNFISFLRWFLLSVNLYPVGVDVEILIYI